MTKDEKEALEAFAKAINLPVADEDLAAGALELGEVLELATAAFADREALDLEALRAALASLELPEELPTDDDALVTLAALAIGDLEAKLEGSAELLDELDALAKRAAYLEGELGKAAEKLDELANEPPTPASHVRWLATGRISRGIVRHGTVASFERGDYAAEDLEKVAHVVITPHTYASRQNNAFRPETRSESGGKAAASSAADAARSASKSEASGPTPRFGALRGKASSGRMSASNEAPAMKTSKRDDKPAPRSAALRGNPKSTKGGFDR